MHQNSDFERFTLTGQDAFEILVDDLCERVPCKIELDDNGLWAITFSYSSDWLQDNTYYGTSYEDESRSWTYGALGPLSESVYPDHHSTNLSLFPTDRFGFDYDEHHYLLNTNCSDVEYESATFSLDCEYKPSTTTYSLDCEYELLQITFLTDCDEFSPSTLRLIINNSPSAAKRPGNSTGHDSRDQSIGTASQPRAPCPRNGVRARADPIYRGPFFFAIMRLALLLLSARQLLLLVAVVGDRSSVSRFFQF